MDKVKDQPKLRDRPFSYWQDRIAGLFAIAAFGAGAWMLVVDRVAAGSAFFVFGALLFFLTNVDRFESFKAGGIEAKMREVKSKVAEAEVLSEQIKGLTVLNAEIAARLLSRIGRWSGPPPRAATLRLFETIESQLSHAEIDQRSVRALFDDWHDVVLTDLCRPAYMEILKCLDERASQFRTDINKPLVADLSKDPDVIEAEMKRDRDSIATSKFRIAWEGGSKGIDRLIETEALWKHFQRLDDGWPKPSAEIVEKSLSEAKYYRENLKFNDPQYWISLERLD